MLLVDEDVGHGSLRREIQQCGLDVTSICYKTKKKKKKRISAYDKRKKKKGSGIHTNFIQLNQVVLCTELVQEGLAGSAVWAIRF